MREIFQIDSRSKHEKTHSLTNDGSTIAIVGTNSKTSNNNNGNNVTIKDCNGKHLHEIDINNDIDNGNGNDIIMTDWNVNGNILAIIYENYDNMTLWYKSNAKSQEINVGFKDPSFFLWSTNNHNKFILGTKKGNIVICHDVMKNDNNDDNTVNVDTILGKHRTEITCGTWTDNDLIVLGSKDNRISISRSSDGQTIQTFSLTTTSPPTSITHTTPCYSNESCGCYISAETGSSIWFYDTSNINNNITNTGISNDDAKEEEENLSSLSKLITIPPDLGSVVCHLWQPEYDSIVIFTSCGKFVIYQSNPFIVENNGVKQNAYEIMEYSVPNVKACKSCFQSQSFVLFDDEANIRLLWCRNKSLEEYATFSTVENNMKSFDVSKNGNVLLAYAPRMVHGFLLHASTVHCCYGTNVAFVSSHREITLLDNDQNLTQLQVDIDPDVLGLGPFHVALGNGKQVHIYDRNNDNNRNGIESTLLQLDDNVKELLMNSKYLAVRTQSAIFVYELGERIIPVAQICGDELKHASCFILTQELLIYGTVEGDICFLHLQTMEALTDIGLQHKSPIIDMCSNSSGTIVVFTDGHGKGLVYDTFNQELLFIPSFPSCKKMMWDQSYHSAFYIFDGREFHAFVINLISIRGSKVAKFGNVCIRENGEISIGKMSRGCMLDKGVIPIICQKGEAICHSGKDSNLVNIASDTFIHRISNNIEAEQIHSSFSKYLVLNYLDDALKCASYAKSDPIWRALGNKAIETMNIQVAIFAFQKLQEVAIVARLEEIRFIEEKNLLSGHLATLFGDFDLAETKFLMSSSPSDALEMRCDFGQWDEALSLATEYFPKDVQSVSIALANELEIIGDLKSSLEVLEQAINNKGGGVHDEELLSMVAKTSLKLGNRKKALTIADDLRSSLLYCELALLLDGQNDHNAAAQLFEMGENISDAIRLWMKQRNLERVTKLLQSHEVFMSTSFFSDYALLCESSGKFHLAVEAYESAGNVEAAIRLCLVALEDTPKALHIMRNKPCKSVAWEACESCKNIMDFESAVEFLVLGEYYNDAFDLAAQNDCVDIFVSLTGEKMTSKLLEDVGFYYESTSNVILAAAFFGRSPQCVEKALNIYVKHGSTLEAIELAKGNDHLTNLLIELLKEIRDKDAGTKTHLHQLYLDMNNWDEAISMGNAAITKHMIEGDYVTSYDIARKTISKLEPSRVPVSLQFRSLFNTLHSYHLAKRFVKNADHKLAAPLLVRVCENIDLFKPDDHLNLFISTVIECNKCGLNQPAIKYSKMLCSDKKMKSQLDKSSFKRKIQLIIRRSQTHEVDNEAQVSPYEYLSNDVVTFPICICSGMFLDCNLDWTFCPQSGMPALLSKYVDYADKYGEDPIKGQLISSIDAKKASQDDVNKYSEYYHSFEKESNKRD